MAPSGFSSIEEPGYEAEESIPATRSLEGADECSVEEHDIYSCLWLSEGDPAARAERLGRQIHACLPGSSLKTFDLLGMHSIDTDEVRVGVLAGMEEGDVLVTIQGLPGEEEGDASTGAGSGSDGGDGTIRFGQTIRGRIDRSDPALADDSHYDEYRFSGKAGEHILVTMQSSDFRPFVTLRRMVDGKSEYVPDEVPSYDEDKIDRTLPETGEFIVRAGTLASDVTGDYTLELKR
jgi:hypothetical protein